MISILKGFVFGILIGCASIASSTEPGKVPGRSESSVRGKTALEKRLLDRENGNQKDEYYGYTPLIHAAMKGDATKVQQLIEGGADVNWTMDGGYDALMVACDQGHVDVVKLLLEKGAKINRVSDDSSTALSLAERNGYPEIVKLLRSSPSSLPTKERKP